MREKKYYIIYIPQPVSKSLWLLWSVAFTAVHSLHGRQGLVYKPLPAILQAVVKKTEMNQKQRLILKVKVDLLKCVDFNAEGELWLWSCVSSLKSKLFTACITLFLSFTATWLKVSKCLQTSQQAICSNLLMTKGIITTLNMEPTLNLDAKIWPQKRHAVTQWISVLLVLCNWTC